MTPTVLPLWLEFIKAVAPLLAALLAAGVGAWVAHKFGRIQETIARQQAETAAAAANTARNKLKFELFDRRLAAYETVVDTIYKWSNEENHTPEIEQAYASAMNNARWLFPSEVHDYLRGVLWGLMIEFHVVCTESPDSEISAKRDLRKRDLIQQLHLHRAKVDEVFASHLALDA